jgi:hypothetical protein
MQTAHVQDPSNTLQCVIRLQAPLFSRLAMLVAQKSLGEREISAPRLLISSKFYSKKLQVFLLHHSNLLEFCLNYMGKKNK